LRAYRHTGFWQCMDTLKEAEDLNQLWRGKAAPWKVWQ
jgi:glucose-1-phosphate cytidylyltransferase